MRTLLQFAVVLALAYGVLLGCTYRYQSRLIYFPGMGPTDPTMTPARLGLRFVVQIRKSEAEFIAGSFHVFRAVGRLCVDIIRHDGDHG